MLNVQQVTVSGANLLPQGTDAEVVRIQYTDQGNTPSALDLPLKNAMFLLVLLENLRQEAGFQIPRDPNTLAPS